MIVDGTDAIRGRAKAIQCAPIERQTEGNLQPPGPAPTRDDKDLSLLRLMEPNVLADPHSFYRALRDHDPVHWDSYMHAWVVTSYPEVVNVLATCSADRTVPPAYLDRLGLSFMNPFAEAMSHQIMFMDGSSHARLRGLCLAAFTPRRIERLRAVIESVADNLLDNVSAAGQVDLVAEFANPLPAIVTAQLLGVPVEDHQLLHAWVLDVAEVLGNFQHHPDRVDQIVRSLQCLRAYIAVQIQELRNKPNDGLISALLSAEVDDQQLTEEEVIDNTILILVGGHETTTSLIAGGFLTLLQRPDAYELLRKNPQIIASAVEELLRFESPSQSTARIAPADLQLGGKVIKKGSRIVAGLAAANRDPNRFPDPDGLDLLRRDNRHVAFGWAAHFCFGAPLARMECQIALNKLLGRLSQPPHLEDKLEWRSTAGFRSLRSLRIGLASGRSMVSA